MSDAHWRWIGAAAAVVFVALNAVNALGKGGDFRVYVESGERVLTGAPMYEGSAVGAGAIGPPFQALAFVPIAAVARLSLPAARLLFYALNVALLAWAIRWWVAALAPAIRAQPRTTWVGVSWTSVLIPLFAVAFPLQTNFEHQNLNVVLLAVLGAAADASRRERDLSAGAWLGFAIALKAFPALLLVPAVVSRRWRLAAAAIGVAALLTTAPVLRYGPGDYLELVRTWLQLGAAGDWPIRGNNQSIFAMLARYSGTHAGASAGAASAISPNVYLVWTTTALALVGGFAIWWWRITRRPAGCRLLPLAFASALVLAIVLSPIGWDHYWVLAFPAFFIVFGTPPRTAHVRWLFWPAAISTSGFSRVTVGRRGLAIARDLSVFTWAGLVLCGAVLWTADALARQSDASVPDMILE